MSIAQNFPEIRPSLNLDFSNVKALDPRVTFSRASSATYYGTETAKAEENLLIRSQEFEAAGWSPTNTTVTANTTAAPDGTTTADTLTATATTGQHLLQRSVSIPAGTYTVSIFAKSGTTDFIQLSLGGFAGFANFDLSTGTVGTTSSLESSGITLEANGFYRCRITFVNVSATTLIIAMIDSSTSARLQSWTPLGTETVFLWGAQVEQRSAVTSYQPTTTQPITRFQPVLESEPAGVARFDHDPITSESLGLLVEEQRTNLLLQSEDFSTSWSNTGSSEQTNVIISPDGTLNGDRLVEDTSTGFHRLNQTVNVVSGTTYTASVYLKAEGRTIAGFSLGGTNFTFTLAKFNLVLGTIDSGTGTITPVGNGWYRCSTSVLATGTGNGIVSIEMNDSSGRSYTGDGYSGIFIWGAQLEEGAFPTSYIKTEASQVTRSADSASMTGANFSSWYRQDEGTLYAEASYNALVTNAPLWNFNDTTTSNIISLQMTSSPASRFSVAVGGTGQANLNPGNLSAQTYFKLCGAYKTDDFSAVLNGGTAQLDTAGVIPVVTRTQIGGVSSAASNVRIKKLAFYPQRLTNAQLQALTG